MMKTFLLVVNIVALTLPFLAAEVQKQAQPACCENDERLFEQKKVLYLLSYPVLNNYPHSAPNYYQNRAAVPINNPYMCQLYYVPSFVLQAQGQIPKEPFLTNIHQSTMRHHQTKYLPFMVIPSKKIPEKATIPATDAIAAPEPPIPVPAAQPAVSSEDTPEMSSEFIHSPDTPGPAEEPSESAGDTPEMSSEFIRSPDTPGPAEEPAESSGDAPEVSSEFIRSPEASSVPVISPVE